MKDAHIKFLREAPLDELLDKARETFKVGFEPIKIGDMELEILQVTDMQAYINKLMARARDTAQEKIELPLWAKVWPTAMVTSFLLRNLPSEGKSLLEVGAGVGLTGLAAAASGFETVLTDISPEALLFCRINILKNNLEDRASVAFADFTKDDLGRKFDYVLGCEVLYRPEFYKPLATFLDRHYNAQGDGEIILALDNSRIGKEFFAHVGETYRIAGRTFDIPGPDKTKRQGAICRMKAK